MPDDGLHGYHEFSFKNHVKRQTVDIDAYPNLVVMVFGIRAHNPRGLLTMLRFQRAMKKVLESKPEGLLHHERLIAGLGHVVVRQYWRDFDTLERFSRADPHMTWWNDFLKDSKGTGFWHEVYFSGGGFEAIYDGMRKPVGMMTFAPTEPPEGSMFTARRRLARAAQKARDVPIEREAPAGEGEGPR